MWLRNGNQTWANCKGKQNKLFPNISPPPLADWWCLNLLKMKMKMNIEFCMQNEVVLTYN